MFDSTGKLWEKLQSSHPGVEGTGIFIQQLPSVSGGGVLWGEWEVLILQHASLACREMVIAKGGCQCTSRVPFPFSVSLPSPITIFQLLQIAHWQKYNATSSKKLFWSSDRINDSPLVSIGNHNAIVTKFFMFLPLGFAFSHLDG